MQTVPRLTADQAVGRGFWTVQLPSMALLVGPLFGLVLAIRHHYVPAFGATGLKWFLAVFIFAFVGGWLVWSIQVPKWRLWAYQRVEDIAELKRKAAAAQLIWPEGSFFQRTEIADRETWARIHSLETAKSDAGLAPNNRWRGP